MNAPRVLVTGAGGYLGTQLVAALAQRRIEVVAADVREVLPPQRLAGVEYALTDVRAPELAALDGEMESLIAECRQDTGPAIEFFHPKEFPRMDFVKKATIEKK